MQHYKNFSVEELFRPTRGKGKYTREYADKNPGDYPVYSASLAKPLCYINHYDYEGRYLTWSTNGYGGRIKIIEGKFSINGDRGILVPITDPVPDLDYIKYYLEPTLISQAVGRVVDGKKNEYTKVGPEIVEKSIISLPVDDTDNIRLEVIAEIGAKIKNIQGLQTLLKKQRELIEDAEISIAIEEPTAMISLGDKKYFTLSIGERLLIKDSLSEGVPAYSANVRAPFSLVSKTNISGFDRPSILWSIDHSLFFYNIIPQDVVFATTDHCGRAQINTPELDPEYVYYYLESTRLEYGFGRSFRSSLGNMASLVEVKVPLDDKGNICPKRQSEIANRYRTINLLKEIMLEKLEVLQQTRVDISQ